MALLMSEVETDEVDCRFAFRAAAPEAATVETAAEAEPAPEAEEPPVVAEEDDDADSRIGTSLVVSACAQSSQTSEDGIFSSDARSREVRVETVKSVPRAV